MVTVLNSLFVSKQGNDKSLELYDFDQGFAMTVSLLEKLGSDCSINKSRCHAELPVAMLMHPKTPCTVFHRNSARSGWYS